MKFSAIAITVAVTMSWQAQAQTARDECQRVQSSMLQRSDALREIARGVGMSGYTIEIARMRGEAREAFEEAEAARIALLPVLMAYAEAVETAALAARACSR